MKPRQQYQLGWKRDLPDHRDWDYVNMRFPVERTFTTLPSSVDLRPHCPPIWNQGNLGSCTAHGIAAMIEFDRIKQKVHVFTPSRLFIYYNERALEGDTDTDAGAAIRDGIKSVATTGYAEEYLWPYDISKFTIQPPVTTYNEAKKFKALSYYNIDNSNISVMKTCLNAGFPVVFGCSVYQSFMDAVNNGGFVPMPSASEQLLGGHCMLCVGYLDAKQCFIVRNSWGTQAGDKGYFYMPYAYLCNPDLTSDCWTIRSVV